MHLGVFSYNVEYGARPDELARAAEERGFESFWVGEHTHIPASRLTPYPGGEPLPKPYYHMADPFVSLMAAAAATRTIKLGTGICLVVEHDPIVLAKSVATLDWLSNGRVLFGIGGGWNREEMEDHGTPFDRRWQVLRERVLAMKALWTQESRRRAAGGSSRACGRSGRRAPPRRRASRPPGARATPRRRGHPRARRWGARGAG